MLFVFCKKLNDFLYGGNFEPGNYRLLYFTTQNLADFFNNSLRKQSDLNLWLLFKSFYLDVSWDWRYDCNLGQVNLAYKTHFQNRSSHFPKRKKRMLKIDKNNFYDFKNNFQFYSKFWRFQNTEIFRCNKFIFINLLIFW